MSAADFDLRSEEEIGADAEAERLRKERELDLITLMRLPGGRRVLGDLIYSRCAVLGAVFQPGDSPEMPARREGRRDIGRQLLGELEIVCPDFVAVMLREWREKPTTRGNEAASAAKDQ